MAIELIDRKSNENKYLHRDFHLILNRAIQHIGTVYGEEGVQEYIKRYAHKYFGAMTMTEIKSYLTEVYQREEADDLIQISLNHDTLSIKISMCPAIRYIKEKGDIPCEYYKHTVSTLYMTIAEISNLKFNLDYYEQDNGAASFSFSRNKKVNI